MATTDALLELDARELALLVLFDGVEMALTDNADLVGYDTGAGHVVRVGLDRDLDIRLAVDLRTGQWRDSPCKISLVDFEGDLGALFAASSPEQRSLGDVPFGAGLPISPSESLAGRAALHGQNVGLERIGPAGQRHQFAVPPGFDIGLAHSITSPSLEIEGAPVSASPLVWNGRRLAIYLVLRDSIVYPDRDEGAVSWRPFSEARRVFVGTLRDAGDVSGRAWSLDADGPESLLRKPMALGFASTPVPAVGDVTLQTSGDSADDGLYIVLRAATDFYGIRNWGALTLTGLNADEIRDEVITAIAGAAALAGADGIWNQQDGHQVAMDVDGTVRISVAGTVSGAGELSLGMHRKRWSQLGYDVEQQNSIHPDEGDARAVEFQAVNAESGAPGDDYWIAYFVTGQSDWPRGSNNDGLLRLYRPLYPGGTAVLLAGLNNGRGQVVRLADATLGSGSSGTTVAHPGQLAWPVASDPNIPNAAIEIDGTPCDTAGFWLFAGKRRFGDGEPFDERWIGLASWAGGIQAQRGLVEGDRIVVTRWMDPTLFGYTTEGGVDSDWIARADASEEDGQITAIPIAMLGYRGGVDLAHIVMQRLMLSTGTSTGWDSVEQDDPQIDAGDNEPAGAHTVRRDSEIAALGLAIPAEWVETPAQFHATAAAVENDTVLDVKVAFTAGLNSEDVLRSLMQPVGWAWHFRGGRFGVWCPADPLTLADATVVLDRSVRSERYSRAGRDRLSQDIRRWQPVDEWKIDRDWKPLERVAGRRDVRQASDPQAPYRPGKVSQEMRALWMRGAGAGLAARLTILARYFAQRHFEVTRYPLPSLRPGLDVWPGTIVRLTDPELLDPVTGYGVTNRIAIVSGTQRKFGQSECSMTADLLVLASSSATPRLNAPVAQGVGYDTATSRLYVRDDWAGIGNGWSDATRFVEPSYTAIVPFGGDAVVECWQWDGTTWAVGLAGTVTSVVTTPGDAYLQLATTSGIYRRDMDTWVVLRPSTIANAEWVDALFAPIAEDTGEWTDSAAAQQSYYPWET